jgi:O-acetyl-ADP-ribose deacetylase (regulator of RNase III)
MLIYKTGDLLEFTEDAFGHGCNCQSTMGSGVAKAVRAKYPEMYHEADCKSMFSKEEKLGKYTFQLLPNNKIGYNIYSQFDYKGRNVGKMDLDYGALENGLMGVCLDLSNRGLKTLALPLIGCGLAGGNWNIVEGILNRISETTLIDICVYINNGFTIEQIRDNDLKK